MPWYCWQDKKLFLDLHVQPGAKRTHVVGEHGGRLKMSLKAAPVEGKANETLIAFLANAFSVPRRQVILVKGVSSRQKRVLIDAPTHFPAWLPRDKGIGMGAP